MRALCYTLFAIYTRRATKLRPHDARMWCAMGQCYESDQLQMTVAAIRCYQRAVSNNDREVRQCKVEQHVVEPMLLSLPAFNC